MTLKKKNILLAAMNQSIFILKMKADLVY